MATVTKSIDGIERITLRVEVRMSRTDLVETLAEIATGMSGAELTDMPTHKALALVRDQLSADAYEGHDSDISPSRREYEWAERQVARFWNAAA
ncbi:hypothetical protein [Acrocarpospora sp. B8E8]|uniref:hypothetical protein n=1 Tax=Acrocarpospora sp. B8E8 TaxID=3153572 RepID=UPI00325F7D99